VGDPGGTHEDASIPHCPLSSQAIAILKEAHALTGRGKFVFPGHRSPNRPMSNNGVLAALRPMGYEKGDHDRSWFRAMAQTILDEVLMVRPRSDRAPTRPGGERPKREAYNRTAHLPERKKMMQQWAEYLDGLKQGAKVVPIWRDVG